MKAIRRLVVLVLVVSSSTLTVLSQPASAQVSFTQVLSEAFLSHPVAVGDVGVRAFLALTNQSVGPGASTVTLNSITLVPSCGTTSSSGCPAGFFDPGVFQLGDIGVGRAGSACADMAFGIALIDADQGKVQFTTLFFQPSVTLSAFGGPGGTCYIDFTFSVLKLPTKDAEPGPGLQTAHIGGGSATSDQGLPGPIVSGVRYAGVTSTPPGRYTPLTPARILDTRDGNGGIGGPIPSGMTEFVQISGRGGVPVDGVAAVALNVTVTEPTGSGFLTLYPAGGPFPLAANLNFTPGKTVPNLAVVKLSVGGQIALYNSNGNTQVVFDVAGWYSKTTAANDGRYTALTPARILDTRDGTGGGVRLGPGASLDLQVAGRGNVPATGAGAAVLNVAVTSTTATSYLTVFPTGLARPLAANLNYNGGDTVSNRVMAKLGAGGRVTIYNNQGSADVVVDVGGWYSDATVSPVNGTYTPLIPSRILDTRDGTGLVNGPIGGGASVNVQVTGRGGVPATGVSAVILNATVTQPAGTGYLTMSPTGVSRPLASDLNYAPAETRPNLVVVAVGTGGKVNLFTSSATHVVWDVAGWFS